MNRANAGTWQDLPDINKPKRQIFSVRYSRQRLLAERSLKKLDLVNNTAKEVVICEYFKTWR